MYDRRSESRQFCCFREKPTQFICHLSKNVTPTYSRSISNDTYDSRIIDISLFFAPISQPTLIRRSIGNRLIVYLGHLDLISDSLQLLVTVKISSNHICHKLCFEKKKKKRKLYREEGQNASVHAGAYNLRRIYKDQGDAFRLYPSRSVAPTSSQHVISS